MINRIPQNMDKRIFNSLDKILVNHCFFAGHLEIYLFVKRSRQLTNHFWKTPEQVIQGHLSHTHHIVLQFHKLVVKRCDCIGHPGNDGSIHICLFKLFFKKTKRVNIDVKLAHRVCKTVQSGLVYPDRFCLFFYFFPFIDMFFKYPAVLNP